MKKLTTNVGVFGPYTSVEVLADRYRCDGADLPIAVVGEGDISDAKEGDFPPPPPPPTPIPQSVTMSQARLALLGAGLLGTVETAIAGAGPAAAIEWEYAQEVQRASGLVPAMATALGLTDAQIDALFVTAATL